MNDKQIKSNELREEAKRMQSEIIEKQHIMQKIQNKEELQDKLNGIEQKLSSKNKTNEQKQHCLAELRNHIKNLKNQIALLDAPLENVIFENIDELNGQVSEGQKQAEDLESKFQQIEASIVAKGISDQRFKNELQRQQKELVKPMMDKYNAKRLAIEKVTDDNKQMQEKCNTVKRDAKFAKPSNATIAKLGTRKKDDKKAGPSKSDTMKKLETKKDAKKISNAKPKTTKKSGDTEMDPYDDMDVDESIKIAESPSVRKFFKNSKSMTPKRVSFVMPDSATKKSKLDKTPTPSQTPKTYGRPERRNSKKLYSADSFELLNESP